MVLDHISEILCTQPSIGYTIKNLAIITYIIVQKLHTPMKCIYLDFSLNPSREIESPCTQVGYFQINEKELDRPDEL